MRVLLIAGLLIVGEASAFPFFPICHKEGDVYRRIAITLRAEPVHRAHGDAEPGELVPGRAPLRFGDQCEVR